MSTSFYVYETQTQPEPNCERCGRKEKLYDWNYCGECIRELTRINVRPLRGGKKK